MTDQEPILWRIANGQVPADFLYQDEDMVVVSDIHPKARVHLLAIPKKLIPSINEIVPEDTALLGKMLVTLKQMAVEWGIAESGHKIVINTGADGGQSVFQLHMHLLGGEKLKSAT